MPKHQEDLNAVFTALADPTRRGVVAELCLGPRSVSELARPYNMALPSFMQHMKVLEKSGLVRSGKQGRTRIYAIEADRMHVAQDWLEAQHNIWEQRLDGLEDYLLKLKENMQ